jgi:hypothetical protein
MVVVVVVVVEMLPGEKLSISSFLILPYAVFAAAKAETERHR